MGLLGYSTFGAFILSNLIVLCRTLPPFCSFTRNHFITPSIITRIQKRKNELYLLRSSSLIRNGESRTITPPRLPSQTPPGRARAGRIITHSAANAMWCEDYVLVTSCLLFSINIKSFTESEIKKYTAQNSKSSCSLLDVLVIHS